MVLRPISERPEGGKWAGCVDDLRQHHIVDYREMLSEKVRKGKSAMCLCDRG